MSIEIYIGSGIIALIAYLFKPVLGEWVKRRSQFFIERRNRKSDAVEKFRQIFIDEREKIKVFNIQDHNIQERAIFEVSRYLLFWRICRMKRIWANYQETENKYRQVSHTSDIPPNHLIHYGDHTDDVLNKINKIIKYLK